MKFLCELRMMSFCIIIANQFVEFYLFSFKKKKILKVNGRMPIGIYPMFLCCSVLSNEEIIEQ